VGVMLEAHARTLRQLVADHARANTQAQPSPLDEWLAALAEPYARAPREPGPVAGRPLSRRGP